MKKVNLMVHATVALVTFLGTCTPIIAYGEQFVSSQERTVEGSVEHFKQPPKIKTDTLEETSSASTTAVSTDRSDQTQKDFAQEEAATKQTNTSEQANSHADHQEITQSSSEAATPVQDDEQSIIDTIGKGENFDGKLYLNYFGEKLKEIFAGSSSTAIIGIRLMLLINDQLLEKNVTTRFEVDVDTIRHLITTYLLYDIAFAKDSSLMSLMGKNDDGTTPSENTGFYPNTQQIKKTTLNNQDGKMMDVYSYYVNQNSDKTVIIHSGFRGNWNNGIVMDEYNDFYQAGYNMLFVDSRATGASGGDFVTYGQYESEDVLYWINEEVSKNPQQKILLYGGSMGAATMMSVLAKNIPTNVKGIIENCGFKSIDEQLRFTYRTMIVPALSSLFNNLDLVADQAHEDLYLGLLKEYYFDREMHLNITENLPVIGMKTEIPKLIIHGSTDSVVPVTNAQELFDLSGGYKDLLIVKDADHGKAQEVASQAYQQHVTAFMDMVFNRSAIVKYVDENNQSLLNGQESQQLHGSYGDGYQTEQKKFAGYEFVKVEGAEQGVFNETIPTIVYHYKKVSEKPTNNGNNNVNNNNGNSVINSNNTINGKNSAPISNVNNIITKKVGLKPKKLSFPRTGEKQGILLSLMGSLLMILAFIGWFY